jgi:hypothetical protein
MVVLDPEEWCLTAPRVRLNLQSRGFTAKLNE